MMATRHATTASPLEALRDDMRALRQAVHDEGSAIFQAWMPMIQRRAFCIGALNLAHYLALRRRDLRDLQARLRPYGLSSLGRAESRVLPNLDAVIASLAIMTGEAAKHPAERAFFRGEHVLHHNTAQLFSKAAANPSRRVRIMVTLPTEAADDYRMIYRLVERGMDAARINCAHDTPEHWDRMVQHIRRAGAELGRKVIVHMDLGGPKPRTADVIGRKEIVAAGDHVLLSKTAPKKSDGKTYRVAARCTIPDVIDQLDVGHSVWIDDGKIGATVESRLHDGVVLNVTHVPVSGAKIKDEKGLNFPDTVLSLRALTDDDIDALDFVAPHADLIGYSFVQTPDDIALLQDQLARRLEHPSEVGIIAKIETPRAIQNLPALIAAAASKQPFGVMIARGDMAIEVGYQRTAEMQEEILWLCEAAHVPVIWATQVLERFVREGTPSRSEMTDAAMAVRAECVMLNKGEFAAEAVTLLDDILTRMQQHQTKKTPQLRALRAWADFAPDSETIA
jgi:pyruvate kinase